MSKPEQPLRSVLFMPGSNAAAISKARGLDVDSVIIDLEDAIAVDEKDRARRTLVEGVRRGNFGWRQIVVRVNGTESPWFEDDLSAISGLPLDAILIPKIEAPADLHTAVEAISDHGIDPSVDLWAMIETPSAVLDAGRIAKSLPRLRCLVVGTNDLAKELHAVQTVGRLSLLTCLSMIVLAARAAGLSVIDGVFTDLENECAFEGACQQGRELGFDGKTLVHPKQIEAANRIFAPSAKEIEMARRVIEAFSRATSEGKGVAVLDGKMIEALHAEEARRLVALAEEISRRSAPD